MYIRNLEQPLFGWVNKLSLTRGKYRKEITHKLGKEAKVEIDDVNSTEWDETAFWRTQARLAVNETLTVHFFSVEYSSDLPFYITVASRRRFTPLGAEILRLLVV